MNGLVAQRNNPNEAKIGHLLLEKGEKQWNYKKN